MHCKAKDLPPLGRRGCCHTLSLPRCTSTTRSPPLPLQSGTCHQLEREKNSAKHNTALSWLSLQNSRGICWIIQRDQRAQSAPGTGWREAQEGLAATRPSSQREHTARIVAALLPAGIALLGSRHSLRSSCWHPERCGRPRQLLRMGSPGPGQPQPRGPAPGSAGPGRAHRDRTGKEHLLKGERWGGGAGRGWLLRDAEGLAFIYFS